MTLIKSKGMARRIKIQIEEKILAIPGVVSVEIGKDTIQGKFYNICVLIEKADKSLMEEVRQLFPSLPIVFTVAGKIRIQ